VTAEATPPTSFAGADAAAELPPGALRCSNLGKAYRRYRSPFARLLAWGSRHRWGTPATHWALRGVSFALRPGEAVGVVGQNGAGKSTLLKLLVGTTLPTEGEAAVQGRVAALLELGMGFHPDFSGRQNVSIALQMMGLPADDRALLARVTSFSELGSFLEQPLRTYSSGMQMRLGFAVATAVRPDLLIVDEALAVGDAYFQHKCIRRIRELRESGTSMLFVSHDPAAVKTLCDRAVLLDGGRLVHAGSAEAVLDYYNALIAQREQDFSIHQAANETAGDRQQTRSGDGAVRIERVELFDRQRRPVRSFCSGETAAIEILLRATTAVGPFAVGFLLRDRLGNDVFGTNTTYLGVAGPPLGPGESRRVRFEVGLELGYGTYAVTVAVHAPAGHVEQNHDWLDNVLVFQVIPGDGYRFAGAARLPTQASFEPA
jgi:lipopolysaccharide transport system ATP-binding protein